MAKMSHIRHPLGPLSPITQSSPKQNLEATPIVDRPVFSPPHGSKTMSTSPMRHAYSTPELELSHSPSGVNSEPLSRTSTFAKTIPFPDKVVYVVRNPTEGHKLKDVEWVIQGSEKHVLTHSIVGNG